MISLRRIFRSPLGGYSSHGSPPDDTEYADGASPPEDEKDEALSPFRIMWILFIGLLISFFYGLLSSALLLYLDSKAEAQSFFVAYASSFMTIIALGLIVGTALIIYRTQDVIPETIEAAFTRQQLSETDYYLYKQRFYSRVRSVTFSGLFVAIGFPIFYFSQFPLSDWAEALMIIAACTQYALGVYVGRKLCYAGMMLHSLLAITVTRNLFRERELDEINSYVHLVSTLTIIFVYIHVAGYYGGPFLYKSVLAQSTKPFLVLPVVIAMPVLLIFNFYPRAVLRKVYDHSIDVEIRNLRDTLHSEELSEHEKRTYLMEVDKMSRDELRYNLQLTLSDLPIGITILIMILQPLLGK
jgi:hypothetical protein